MPDHTPPGFREYIDYRIWDLERLEKAHRLVGSADDEEELHVPDDDNDIPEYDPEVDEEDLDEDDLLAE